MALNKYSLNIEPEILKYWEKNDVYGKVKSKNKGKPKFYFLQGPPYTSGRLHIGHAWNNTAKDIILRYKRMRGFDVWDRAGYDMHGLPTANYVMKKLNLKTKEDIEEYGIDKFTQACLKFSSDNALLMDKDLWRFGVWLDFDNAYWPINNVFMEGEWWLIKKAFTDKRLYKGKKVMTWCSTCETALAKHELEYKTDKDTSIFMKFKVDNNKNEYLIIWTTTPWTIPYNLAVMVNPELEYVKAKVENETWIISKALVNALMGAWDKKYEILETFNGNELEGIKYIHPMLEEIPSLKEVKNKFEKTHSIVLSTEYVDVTAGSGLVHCAPGCGPEDYEVGQKYGLPAYNNLNEQGMFENMGAYDGKIAKVDDKFFIERLKELGVLIQTTPVEHEYAHCWRCRNPVVFRATKQWFMKVEDLREKIISENQGTYWVPEKSKEQYDAWMSNLKDNSIARQRYWGCPVPIWECECGHVEVIGSAKELEEKAIDNKIPKDFHRPWIDEVKIKCPKCSKEISRLPDVLDVWIDSGTNSWTCLDYPKNKELFEKLWPADLVLEATEHVRLWFSMLNICSMIAFNKRCFDNAYVHGMILDWHGTKMSKSLGNVISPYEVVDKYGIDVLRYYMNNNNAGENFNFSWEDCKNKQRSLIVFWNVHNFLLDISKEIGKNPFEINEDSVLSELGVEERFILSRLNSVIKKVTELFDAYRIDETITVIENLFLDLSRIYIQSVREKAATGSATDKEVVLYTINKVFFESLKIFTTISPFICEQMYLNLKNSFGLKELSINLFEWPSYNDTFIDKELEKNMQIAGSVIQSILSAREKSKLSVRWPVLEVDIVSENPGVEKALNELKKMILSQTNVKKLNYYKIHPKIKQSIKLNFASVKSGFGDLAPKIIAKFSGIAQDEMVSDLNKKGKYMIKIDDKNLEITKAHVIFERQIPEGFVDNNFRFGYVLLNKKRNPELDSEGYSREIMRRVQAARKKAGLEKTDSIMLYIQTDEKLKQMLLPWKDKIQLKVGASKMKIDTQEPAKKHSNVSEEKVKEKKFYLHFEKE
ncbi:isoleucine--tRNA ligase [Candidatus Woesearchaeota archaeon]|nr:isoleucine--tRNA ligase [Candidatus Woesearchaeota archaeon]